MVRAPEEVADAGAQALGEEGAEGETGGEDRDDPELPPRQRVVDLGLASVAAVARCVHEHAVQQGRVGDEKGDAVAHHAVELGVLPRREVPRARGARVRDNADGGRGHDVRVHGRRRGEEAAAAAKERLGNGGEVRVEEDAEVVALPHEVLHAEGHAAVRVRGGAAETLERVADAEHAQHPERAVRKDVLGLGPHPHRDHKLDEVAPDVERLTGGTGAREGG